MSSRIEKGGARFKPAIVPRRSTASATSGTAVPSLQPSPSTRRLSQASTAGSPPFGPSTSTVPASPSLRPTLPPSIGSASSLTSGAPLASASHASASASSTAALLPSSSASAGANKSFAFTPSPARITLGRQVAVGSSAHNSATTNAASTFKRPAVSRQAPGASRASATPTPTPAPAPASSSTSALHASSTAILPGSTRQASTSAATAVIDSNTSAQQDSSSSQQPTARPPKRSGTAISVGAGRVRGATEAESSLGPLSAAVPQPDSEPQSFVSDSISHAVATDPSAQNANVPSQRSEHQARSSESIEKATSTSQHAELAPARSSTRAKRQKTTRTAKNGPVTEAASTSIASAAVTLPNQHSPTASGDDEDESNDSDEAEAQADQDKEARRAKRLVIRQRRKLKEKEHALGKPKRPTSAYLIYMNSARPKRREQFPTLSMVQITSLIAGEWRQLSEAEKSQWEARATQLKQQYEQSLHEWEQKYPDGVQLGPSDDSDLETASELDADGNKVRRKRTRGSAAGRAGMRKKRTVSDDEREYFEQMETEGPGLPASRIDPANISMGEISAVNFKKGRAGPRTFELDRVRRRQADERKAAREEAEMLARTGKRSEISPHSDDQQAARRRATASVEEEEEQDEEIVGFIQGEEEVVPDAIAEEEDAESVTSRASKDRRRRRRAPSVAGTEHSFVENRFAVQTRIVDGKIVVDETSLFANYGNAEDDRDGMEIIDEREGDRFVNSASRGKGQGRLKKWSQEDTAKFYKAVQQWGTDFEMISRLFPGRDRVMIKKKWNLEERTNPRMIDDALNHRVAIDLDAYAQAAGVDLSGPPPEISADLGDIGSLAELSAKVKKREGTEAAEDRGEGRGGAEDEDDEYEYEEEIEIDEHGNETVTRKRIGKKGATGKKKRGRKKSMASSYETGGEAAAPPSTIAASSTQSAGETASAPAGGDTRPPAIKTRSRRRGNSTASNMAEEREKRHRAATLRGSEAPTDRMEVEEIVGEV